MPRPRRGSLSLVVYCTGHGLVPQNTQDWRLAERDSSVENPTLSVTPADIVLAVNRPAVGKVLLVLDACYAGEGAGEAFAVVQRALRQVGGGRELCIVAAVPHYAEARQNVFAPALAKALRDASVPSWDQAFLSMETVEGSLQRSLRRWRQRPRVMLGREAGSLMLPNPAHVPRELPAGWRSGRLVPWSGPARGVAGPREPGWFFTGRDAALAELWQHACAPAEAPGRLRYLAGPSGSGRTALLARMLTTATDGDRAALPAVARTGALPPRDVAVAAVRCRDRTVDDVRADVVAQLGRDPTAEPGDGRPAAVLLDDVAQAADPPALLAWAAELTGARVVAVLPAPPDDPPGDVTALGAPEHAPAPDLSRYLRLRTSLTGRPADEPELKRLTTAAGGSFAAAVRAADAWAAAADRGLDPLEPALADAAERLSADRAATLAAHGVDHRTAAAAVDVLTEVSCWEEGSGLPPELWAALASARAGRPCGPATLAAAAPALGLVPAPGTRDGALRVPGPATGVRLPDLVPALVDAVRPTGTGRWDDVDPPVLCAVAGAAARTPSAVGLLLRDAAFLLACPPAAVTRALRAGPPVPEPLQRAWAQVPSVGRAADRAFALRLAAARQGITELHRAGDGARPGEPDVLTVLAANGFSPRSGTADVVRSAVAPVPGDPAVATAHDDGSLTLWGGDDLRRLATCRPPFAGAAVAGLAATAVDGGLGEAGEVVVVATSRHGQVARWSASRETAAEPWDVTADDVAALAGGRLLLVGPDGLTSPTRAAPSAARSRCRSGRRLSRPACPPTDRWSGRRTAPAGSGGDCSTRPAP